jgi:hypothetical protein
MGLGQDDTQQQSGVMKLLSSLQRPPMVDMSSGVPKVNRESVGTAAMGLVGGGLGGAGKVASGRLGETFANKAELLRKLITAGQDGMPSGESLGMHLQDLLEESARVGGKSMGTVPYAEQMLSKFKMGHPVKRVFDAYSEETGDSVADFLKTLNEIF